MIYLDTYNQLFENKWPFPSLYESDFFVYLNNKTITLKKYLDAGGDPNFHKERPQFVGNQMICLSEYIIIQYIRGKKGYRDVLFSKNDIFYWLSFKPNLNFIYNNGKTFFVTIDENIKETSSLKDEIFEKYPEEYKNYLKNKQVKKFKI